MSLIYIIVSISLLIISILINERLNNIDKSISLIKDLGYDSFIECNKENKRLKLEITKNKKYIKQLNLRLDIKEMNDSLGGDEEWISAY